MEGPFWWQQRGSEPPGRACYRTKTDALKAFLADPLNARTAEEASGAGLGFEGREQTRRSMYERCSGVFDAINQKYDLVGSDKACTLDDAMWHTLRRRSPREGFCVEDVDTDALNQVLDDARIDARFNVPLDVAMARAEYEEAEHAKESRRPRRPRKARRASLPPRARSKTAGEIGGPGWPLTGYECFDRDGLRLPCSEGGVERSGRVIYRPRVGKQRLARVYLDEDDEAVTVAAEERSTRVPVRHRAHSAAERAEEFDPAEFAENPHRPAGRMGLDTGPGSGVHRKPMKANPRRRRAKRRTPPRHPRRRLFLPRSRRRRARPRVAMTAPRRRRNPAMEVNPMETAYLVNPRRRRRRRRNPLGISMGNPRRRRRNPEGGYMGSLMNGAIGGLVYAGGFLLVRKLVLSHDEEGEHEGHAKAWDTWRPFVKLGLGVGGWLLLSRTRFRGIGTVMLYAGLAHAATDLLGPVFKAKGFDDDEDSRPEGTGFDSLDHGGRRRRRGGGKKKAKAAMKALEQLMVVREQQMRGDDDDELAQDDDELAEDDDELEAA